ncbi:MULTISPECIES: TetR family transcriptional regulator [Mycobacteriaceae]|uniref:TetR family transcriptional regulator n=1 Tax=Mycolicibacterium porcinum TaxID=39693 RepID=A0AAW5T1C4_9MYCO|nr:MULTISPECIES: TetR family transcriptional regulator [Mycobacteriaceae]MCV7388003.1 TetR family transcriptional regulator [Mycolicibacterium porcinum]ORB43458.1 TetR family transcriptional regulator [Mycolicibacterium porcinum]CDO31311.1 TetR family transcriptional regulator [Mycolicibacterium vulneris]
MARGDRSPRVEHADRVRNALLEAALDLFSANGYDETTTDQIAESAGVSPRTFFRYFPTKESVLFFGEYDFIDAVSGVYLAQPEEVSDFEAMANSFALLAPSLKRIRKRIAQYHEAVASSLVLLGRERRNHEANAETVAKVIADRRRLPSPDSECHLLASIGMLLVERALNQWLAAPGRALDDLVRQEFAALPAVLK